MYTQVTFYDFVNSFNSVRPDNFSREGLIYLYEYLESLEADTGEPMQLDVIAICCDFSEEPLSEVLDNYGLESLDELSENTVVVAELTDDRVVYQTY